MRELKQYSREFKIEALRLLETSGKSAARMRELIQGLLAYSWVSTHSQPRVETQSEAVLEKVLDNLKITIMENAAVVTYDPLPVVLADLTQLSQLFQNLISNALKFHGECPSEIHVGAECHEDRWNFSVCDNGIGIERQFAERIFVIFQRLHTRDEFPGTGVGLSICKRIVERHGGRIWVESEPGQGSCFYFDLADGKRNAIDGQTQRSAGSVGSS